MQSILHCECQKSERGQNSSQEYPILQRSGGRGFDFIGPLRLHPDSPDPAPPRANRNARHRESPYLLGFFFLQKPSPWVCCRRELSGGAVCPFFLGFLQMQTQRNLARFALTTYRTDVDAMQRLGSGLFVNDGKKKETSIWKNLVFHTWQNRPFFAALSKLPA